MEGENKFIVAKNNRVGKMRLFGEIDSEGVMLERFLLEFESLENDDSIDEIEVLINSIGGNVFMGFPIITAINNSKKQIITVVDSIAASMAALIFLAGKVRKVHPYSQLMLHSARSLDGSKSDALTNTNDNIFNLIKAVTKRAKDKIKNWLSKDTWFTAAQAIENSLATEILPSKMALVDSYQHEIRGLVASGAFTEEINNNLKSKYSGMEEILNELNLQGEASKTEVRTKIQEIKSMLATREQELINREAKIQELQGKVDAFEQKEKLEQEKAINDLIEAAFTNRQINAEAKPIWKSILETDFTNGSKAIKALAKTEKISDVVNTHEEASKLEYQSDPIQKLMEELMSNNK